MLKTWFVLLLMSVASNATAQLSVPSAYYGGDASRHIAESAQLRLPVGAPARAIALAPPAAVERTRAKSMRSARTGRVLKASTNRGLEVGFAREVPSSERNVRFAELAWMPTAGGTKAARVALNSPGAVALRIELALDAAPRELVVRFAGSRAGAPQYGPYRLADLMRDGDFWSPVLEGDTAIVELELPALDHVDAASLQVPMVSHLGIPGVEPRALDLYIGQSEACEQDVACLAPSLQQQLSTAIRATARIFVTVKGRTLICSGTLLNDLQGSFTPYFLTTNHCIDDIDDPAASRGIPAAAAASVNTYWFFEASTCGNRTQPAYVLVADGAKLLARGADFDWSLLRLNSVPPSGTTFAAWNAAAPIASGTAIVALHHPSGDLKKVSQGNVSGYMTYPDNSSFIQARWSSGVTESGSSGGGLFVFNPSNGSFELRGALVGGTSSCSFTQGMDEFSRFDVLFPLVQQYLAQGASNPTKIQPVVEFYSAAKNDYWLAIDPAEIAMLDGGANAGWVRTGLRFLAYTDPTAAPVVVQPVCRFYLPPASGDTHFLSASPQECADARASHPDWVYESAAAFYVAAPAAGSGLCPASTQPVYRFLSNVNVNRRRYTAEVVMRDSVIEDGGWTQEGIGPAPDRVAMCAPTGVASIVPPTSTTNYEGIWEATPPGSQSGWGINLAHQGDIIFATWFTYDLTGKGWWLSMTANRTGENTFSGLLQETNGPPYYSMPFDPARVTRNTIGAGTLTFTGTDSGTFGYALNGTAQTKTITRFRFGPMPSCAYSAAPNLAAATNYQGLWQAASGNESGWGATLTHQGDVIFMVWYTYEPTGGPLWLSATAQKVAQGVYAGTFYRTNGPPYNAVPFSPALVTQIPVGTMQLAFAGGDSGSFSYTIGGVTQTRQIARLLFRPPAATLCQ